MTCLHCLLLNHCSVVVWSSDHLILILTLCLMLSQLKTNYNDVCCTYIYICVCEWLHLVTSTRVDLFLHKVFTVNVHFFVCYCSSLRGKGGGGSEYEEVDADHSLQSCKNYCKGKSCWNQLTTRKNCQRMREGERKRFGEREREKVHYACIVCTQGHCPLTVKNSPVTAAQKSSQGLRVKTADEEGPLQ